MNNHTSAIVPIEAWLYHSPELKIRNIHADVGLVCEALIYYDKIFICVDSWNWKTFNELIDWFVKCGEFDRFIELIKDGIIDFVCYAFNVSAIHNPKKNIYSLVNMQEDNAVEKDVFMSKIVYNRDLNVIINSRQRKRLYKAIESANSHIELKVKDFEGIIENANSDFRDPSSCRVLVQSFMDQIYKEFGYGTIPKVSVSINKMTEDITRTTWNIDFLELDNQTGKRLNIRPDLPLIGVGHCNRIIETASMLRKDLFLGTVMSSLVNNKIAEVNFSGDKTRQTINELYNEVDFPKISLLVNQGEVSFKDVLIIRNKAKRFRQWLQEGGDKDRSAIVAYHNEVAKEVGLKKMGKGALSLVLVGAGGALGGLVAGPTGGTAGAIVGKGVDTFLSSINAEWSPVVFGTWLTKYIK